MTVREAIEQAHCRQGKAAGTTKDGAYWLACEAIPLRSYGGDGIGQSAPSMTSELELRHYRNGMVRARCHFTSWHQNGSYSGGGDSQYVGADKILGCETAEDVIVALKDLRYGAGYDSGTPVYGYGAHVAECLAALGIREAAPTPDEAVA